MIIGVWSAFLRGNNMKIHYRSAVWTASFFALAALVWPGDAVRAQDEAAAAGTLEEIIVTARRREESLMDTPVSITAFTNADLEARQIINAADIDQAVPNMVYRTNGIQNNNAAVIFIRGIGQWDFIPTKQPGIGVYVDGGYVATSVGSALELLDIESIEVLRGPQGTLFGRNTIGGALVINSVRPHDEFEGQIDAGFGELSRQQVRGTVNVPFTENFFGKFSAMHKSRDGYVDTPNVEGDDGLGSHEVTAARVALRWINDSVTADLTVDMNHSETDGVPTVIAELRNIGQVAQWNNRVVPNTGHLPWTDEYVPPPGSAINYQSEYFPAEADILSTNFTLEWDISDSVTFKTITTWRELEDFGGRDSDYSPLDVHINVDITESEQITQEFQFSGVAADGRLDWIAGYFYFAEDTLNLDAVHFPFFGLLSGSYVENQSTALYGQFTYDVTDRLSLTVGGRNTKERFDNIVDDRFQFVTDFFTPGCNDDCPLAFPDTFAVDSSLGGGFAEVSRRRIDGYRPFPDPPHQNQSPVPLAPNGLTETDKDATEPYLNLAYRFNESIMGYVSYSEGFKGGGFTQRIPPGRVVESFGPETAHVVEVGFKWQGTDGRARVTGAAFSTNYDDMQVDITTELGGGLANAAKAVVNGFELEAIVQVTPQFMLSGGIGKLDGKYEELAPTVTLWTLDSVLPNLPETQATLSGSYTAPLPSGELTARLDYSYNGELYARAQNEVIIPSYSLLNGSIVYAPNDGNWEVAIQGRNLADKFYADYWFFGDGDATTNRNLEPPREIMGRFTYRF